MKKRFLVIGLSVVFSFAALTSAFAGTWRKDAVGRWAYNDGIYVKKQWKNIDGKLYCFDADGIMYENTYTPDGYWVGPDGAWVETMPRAEWPIDANGYDVETMRGGEALIQENHDAYIAVQEANRMFGYSNNYVLVKDYVYGAHMRFYKADGSLCHPNDGGTGYKPATHAEFVLTRTPYARDQVGQMEVIFSWGLMPYKYDGDRGCNIYIYKYGNILSLEMCDPDGIRNTYGYNLLDGSIEYYGQDQYGYDLFAQNVNCGYRATGRDHYDYKDQLYYWASEYPKPNVSVFDQGNNVIKTISLDTKSVDRVNEFQLKYTSVSWMKKGTWDIKGDYAVYSSYHCKDENGYGILMEQGYDKRTGKLVYEAISRNSKGFITSIDPWDYDEIISIQWY